MKFNKRITVLAAVITSSVVLSACQTGTVGDNAPKVFANPLTEKYTFTDNDKTFKLKYTDPWRAVDGGDYDIAIIPSDDNENPVIKLSIRSDEKTDNNSDDTKAKDYYGQDFDTGIISSSEFTLGEDKGSWLFYSSVADSGYDIEGIDTDTAQTDEYKELGYIIKDKNVYVFKLTTKDKATMDVYREQALEVLQGIEFLQ